MRKKNLICTVNFSKVKKRNYLFLDYLTDYNYNVFYYFKSKYFHFFTLNTDSFKPYLLERPV